MNDEIIEFIQDDSPADLVDVLRLNLSYAQSLDGSIALFDGQSVAISGPESLELTHQLRANHQSILVGIGTVLADDPQLSVREIEGNDPQPLILDSHLRFPLDAKLLENDAQPWIFCLDGHDRAKRKALETRGAKVHIVSANQSGRIDLTSFIGQLRSLEIKSVMLEGGATLIASFMASRLIHKVIITIAPSFIGGLNVLQEAIPKDDDGNFPQIQSPKVKQLGDDLIVWGKIK